MFLPVCSDCGEELCYTTDESFSMKIEPCENCMAHAREEAKQELTAALMDRAKDCKKYGPGG